MLQSVRERTKMLRLEACSLRLEGHHHHHQWAMDSPSQPFPGGWSVREAVLLFYWLQPIEPGVVLDQSWTSWANTGLGFGRFCCFACSTKTD